MLWDAAFGAATDVRRALEEVAPEALLGTAALLVTRGLVLEPVDDRVGFFGWLRSFENDGPRGVVNGRLGGIDVLGAGLLRSERRELLSGVDLEGSFGGLPLDAAVEDRTEGRSGGGMLDVKSFFRGLMSIEYMWETRGLSSRQRYINPNMVPLSVFLIDDGGA